MISAWWLLMLIPFGFFMFFLGVAMCNNSRDSRIKEGSDYG